MFRKIFFALLIVFIAIQFIRPARNLGSLTSITDIEHRVQMPDTVFKILKTSCYDCHSNHTDYPWYVNINPVGLWLRGHINDGKRALNFSDLSSFNKRKLLHRLGDIAEQVEEKKMPLPSYLFIHKYAKLEPGQVKILKDWVDASKQQVGIQE